MSAGIPRIIEAPRAQQPLRRPAVAETEWTTVWNDGTCTRQDRFGRINHRRAIPVRMDADMQAFYQRLDGGVDVAAKTPVVIALTDLDEGGISL